MAGITYLEEFQKPALRGLVDETIQDSAPTIADRFLPTEETYDYKFAYDIIKSSKYIAPMIGHGGEPPVVDRDAVASMHGEIAKMGLKDIITEEELLALNQARNNGERQAMIEKITLKGVDLVQAIQRRIDVTKMEVLTKGRFDYKKHGIEVTVDFGIPAEHKVALTSGNDWNETNRDVIGDLLEWVSVYEETNGKAPDVILMSREVNAKLLKNKYIIAEAGRPEGSTRASQEDLNNVLTQFGLPPVEVITDRKVTVRNLANGKNEIIEFFPVNRLVMVSEGVGNYLLGPTVENDFEPGIFLGAYDERNPIRSVLEAVAAGFPTVEQPGLIFHADVFTV